MKFFSSEDFIIICPLFCLISIEKKKGFCLPPTPFLFVRMKQPFADTTIIRFVHTGHQCCNTCQQCFTYPSLMLLTLESSIKHLHTYTQQHLHTDLPAKILFVNSTLSAMLIHSYTTLYLSKKKTL